MNYQKIKNNAAKIEALVEECLDIVENSEPIRTPLLNLRGDLSHLRDSIASAKAVERVDA